ncbi:MAG TPA: hypothetical protein VFB60_02325 [Ktedonobacteraceae bacterium]|nr:hypothetical protein [Ktedonobacteraceae bacterium]
MVGTLKQPSEQPEESPLQKYIRELAELRALILYGRNQRKLLLESLDVMERGLSDIIGGIDRLIPIYGTLLSLEQAQVSVIKARKKLLVAADILEQSLEKSRPPSRSEKLYDAYDECAAFLLKAKKHLEDI